MTQETPTWLDYSKPPPGYRVDEQDGEWDWSVGGDVPSDGNAHLITTEDDALAAAWAHYKAKHDPPGCSIGLVMSGQGATTRGDFVIDWGDRQGSSVPAYKGKAQRAGAYQEAHAAAWAWHDRRRAIVVDVDDQLCSGGRELAAWLASALAWTEAECAEIEAYAALPFPRSVDMPQALQRVLLPEAAR